MFLPEIIIYVLTLDNNNDNNITKITSIVLIDTMFYVEYII